MRNVRSWARRMAGAAKVAAAVASVPLRKRRRSTVVLVMLFLLLCYASDSVEAQDHAVDASRLDQSDGFINALEAPYLADEGFEIEQTVLDEAQRLREIEHRPSRAIAQTDNPILVLRDPVRREARQCILGRLPNQHRNAGPPRGAVAELRLLGDAGRLEGEIGAVTRDGAHL